MDTKMKTVNSKSADDCLRAVAQGLTFPRPVRQLPGVDTVLHRSYAPPAPLPPRKETSAWEPGCSHSTMAVIYRRGFRCSSCGQEPPFGCLYRCVMDKDPLLLEAKDQGHLVVFDDLSRQFADQMSLGRFGPDRRSKECSLLDEMTAVELASYTPEQLATLLSQRDNVLKVIANTQGSVDSPPKPPALGISPHNDRPWIPNQGYECQYKICHACHRIGREKSWVSLNAVLSGDILPHVATGFSFGAVGVRPVVDANILRNIGRRAVSLPQEHPLRTPACRKRKILHSTAHEEANTTQSSLCDALPSTTTVEGTVPRHAASAGTALPAQGSPSAVDRTDGAAAIPRSLPDETVEISVDDFILDYPCSEYTLACCTPLPVAGPEEEHSLADEALVELSMAPVISTSSC